MEGAPELGCHWTAWSRQPHVGLRDGHPVPARGFRADATRLRLVMVRLLIGEAGRTATGGMLYELAARAQ